MSIETEMTVEGIEEMLKDLDKAIKAHVEALGAALYQEGSAIMTASAEICPVDENYLLPSKYVGNPILHGGEPIVELGYGKQYAVYVHERVEKNINWSKSGTSAKFLQIPVDKAKSGYAARIAKRTDRNIKTGQGMAIRGTHNATPSSGSED